MTNIARSPERIARDSGRLKGELRTCQDKIVKVRDRLKQRVPACREVSLVITKLEEAEMWLARRREREPTDG